MEPKLCKNCETREAKPGEKFCPGCRAGALREMRKAAGIGDEPMGVRTIYSRGADMVGRKCRDCRVNFDEPRDDT
jgi:hypothetical protein